MPPMLRLRRAGLTDADEPEVRARWAAMTNAERLEAARAMQYVDDEELARQVVEMREEAAGDRAAAEALAGYVVGEQGPETVTFDRPATVTPAGYSDEQIATAAKRALAEAYPDGLPAEPPKRRRGRPRKDGT